MLLKGRPTDVPEEDVFLCESRYDEDDGGHYRKLKGLKVQHFISCDSLSLYIEGLGLQLLSGLNEPVRTINAHLCNPGNTTLANKRAGCIRAGLLS